jgi:hypothetical protein
MCDNLIYVKNITRKNINYIQQYHEFTWHVPSIVLSNILTIYHPSVYTDITVLRVSFHSFFPNAATISYNSLLYCIEICHFPFPAISSQHLCSGILYPATAMRKHISAVSILLVCSFVNVQYVDPYKRVQFSFLDVAAVNKSHTFWRSLVTVLRN